MVIGSTEGAILPNLVPSVPSEWNYFIWSSAAGAVMEPAEEELYELVLKRKDIGCQGVFTLSLKFKNGGPRISSNNTLRNLTYGSTKEDETTSSYLAMERNLLKCQRKSY
jgi:hypothetical protein